MKKTTAVLAAAMFAALAAPAQASSFDTAAGAKQTKADQVDAKKGKSKSSKSKKGSA